MSTWDVIIVGSGIAGVSAARTLAEEGAGRILLVNGESEPPYKRTKLSKNISNRSPVNTFALEQPEWYEANGVTLINEANVSSIDPEARSITLDNESTHEYGAIVLATGAEPLYPPTIRAHESSSYHVLRSAADLEGLRKSAHRAKRILVDGMGVLAVEVAAQLKSMGKKVTLVGATPQLMPRHLNERAGEVLEDLIRSNGIRLRFQEEILSFEQREKGDFAVATIRESAHYDLIVFCIGVQPRTEIAREAGAEVGRGIVVDQHLQTSVPAIYAAGDCAEHNGGVVTDLWHAAEYQGQLAARNALRTARNEDHHEEFDNPAFRLKCEVFGHYFFSVGKPRNPLEFGIEEHESGDVYRCFYFDGDALVGVVMIDDKERAKDYERAVRERWSRETVVAEFLGGE